MSKAMDPLVFDVAFQRLVDFAADVGVAVLRVPESRWGEHVRQPSVDASPVCGDLLAVDYDAWHVYVRKPLGTLPEILGGVLHEIAHVAASLRRPKDAQELDFLGWEYAAARHCEIVRAWKLWMDTYALSDGTEFGELLAAEQYATCRFYLSDAIARGMVTKGTQRPLRVRWPVMMEQAHG